MKLFLVLASCVTWPHSPFVQMSQQWVKNKWSSLLPQCRFFTPSKPTMRNFNFFAVPAQQPIRPLFNYGNLPHGAFSSLFVTKQSVHHLYNNNNRERALSEQEQIALFNATVDNLLDANKQETMTDHKKNLQRCAPLLAKYPALNQLVGHQMKSPSIRQFLHDFWDLRDDQLPGAVATKKQQLTTNIASLPSLEKARLLYELSRKFC